MLLFAVSCNKANDSSSEPNTKDESEISDETTALEVGTAEAIDYFKTGKWISSKGIYYFFNETKGYLEHREAPETNTAFDYKIIDGNSAVFNMENDKSSKKADVDFKKPGVIDIIWENGDAETLTFDTEEIPDHIK